MGVTLASVPGLGVLVLIRVSAYDDRVGHVQIVIGFAQLILPHSGKIAYWMYQMYSTTGIQK